MNKTLQEIQSELKVWTEYNFGQQTPEISILGMIEELGELSHAILKEKQGIRTSDFLADKKDAIADLTIYCLNYFNSIEVVVSQNTNSINSLDYEFKAIQIIASYIAALNTKYSPKQDSLYCNVIIVYIKRLCNKLDIDFFTTVNEVWEQVKLRDWKKYPKDGRTN